MSGRALTPGMLFEHFRGSGVEHLLASGTLGATLEKFDEAEVAQEFDAQQPKLRAKRNQAELDRLVEKMRHGGLSADEDARYLRLTQERHALQRVHMGLG